MTETVSLADLENALVVVDKKIRLETDEDLISKYKADAKEIVRLLDQYDEKGYVGELPENVEDYENVTPEIVSQQEQRRLMQMQASPYGAMSAQFDFGTKQALRYMGFGEYGEKKTVTDEQGNEKSITRWDEMAYSNARGSNSLSRWLLSAEAYAPQATYALSHIIPSLSLPKSVEAFAGRKGFLSTEQYYNRELEGTGISGAEFLDMSPNEREDVLIENKQIMARKDNEITATVLDVAPPDKNMEAIGTILSELSDPLLIPTVLASSGGTLPMFGATAAYSLQSEASRQAHADIFDPEGLGTALLSSLGITAITAPIQTTGLVYRTAVRAPVKATEVTGKKILNLVNNSRATKGSSDVADSIVEKLEQRTSFHLINTKQTNGKPVTGKQALALAQKDLNLSTARKLEIIQYSSRDFAIPNKKQATQILATLDNPVPSTTMLGKVWDSIGTPLTTVVANIDKKLAGALRNHDMRLHVSLANSMTKTEEFSKSMLKLSKSKDPKVRAEYENLEIAMLSGNRREAEHIIKKISPEDTKLLDEYNIVRKQLDNIYDRATGVSIKMGYLSNYMPRYIKDLDGMKKALGVKESSAINRALEAEAKKRGYQSWTQLDDEIAADVITRTITRTTIPKGKKRLESQRKIIEIPPHLKKFYHDVPTSLQLYINKAEREIAKQEFFGASAKYNPLTGKIDLDESINASIGKHILDMKKRGKKVDDNTEGDLRLLFKARFEAADKAMGKTWANVRDLQYAALLAQFDSALIQLGDIGSSLYLNGIANTAKALVTGNKNAKLTSKDFGLVNQISAEMNNLNGLNKFLDRTLTYSGFRAIDRLGKDTFLKAAWLKNTKLARNNPNAIVKKYGQVFENETGDLISDLQQGLVTDRTKLLLWNELADVQPIALSEMPRRYLEMKDGRILWSLKSYGLKQLDLIRKNIINKARSGDVTGAFEEALRYSMLMGLSGATVENARNLLRGGTEATQSMDDAAFESLAKILFVSKYSRERFLQEGQYGSYIINAVMPAAPSLLDDVGVAFNNILFEQETDQTAFDSAINNVPVLGRVYYYQIGGGAEKLIEKVEKAEREKLEQ